MNLLYGQRSRWPCDSSVSPYLRLKNTHFSFALETNVVVWRVLCLAARCVGRPCCTLYTFYKKKRKTRPVGALVSNYPSVKLVRGEGSFEETVSIPRTAAWKSAIVLSLHFGIRGSVSILLFVCIAHAVCLFVLANAITGRIVALRDPLMGSSGCRHIPREALASPRKQRNARGAICGQLLLAVIQIKVSPIA